MIYNEKSKFWSFFITVWSLGCAVAIGFFPDFSWWLLGAILVGLFLSLTYSSHYNNGGLSFCRFLIGMLFIFSGLTKGVDPMGTGYKMTEYFYAYHIEWMNPAALTLAVMLIMAEFSVGMCLLMNILPRLATLGASLLMAFFTITTLLDALFNLVADCGCFGAAITMTNWQTFFKNLVILIVLIPLILNNKILKNKVFTATGQWILALALTGLFVIFEVHNIRHLPIVDFMPWKVGKDMRPKQDDEMEVYLTFRNSQTGETKEYLSSDYPYYDTEWMNQWEYVSQRTVGGITGSLLFSMNDENDEDFTDLLFDTDSLVVFVAPYLNEMDNKAVGECKRVNKMAADAGFRVIWITATDASEVNRLNKWHGIFNEVYYGDELELKTMIRSNPGLMLMDGGVVLGKWSRHDFPDTGVFDRLLARHANQHQ